jgi:hypothetical protein
MSKKFKDVIRNKHSFDDSDWDEDDFRENQKENWKRDLRNKRREKTDKRNKSFDFDDE